MLDADTPRVIPAEAGIQKALDADTPRVIPAEAGIQKVLNADTPNVIPVKTGIQNYLPPAFNLPEVQCGHCGVKRTMAAPVKGRSHREPGGMRLSEHGSPGRPCLVHRPFRGLPVAALGLTPAAIN